MSNEDQIEELKRIIEEEKEQKRVRAKESQRKYREQDMEKYNTRSRLWKQAHKEYDQQYREKHKGRINASGRERKRRMKEELVALKGGKCMDCGGVFPAYAYDFHHINGRDVKINTLTGLSRVAMLEEVNKCVLLCAVCHRGRHVADSSEEDEL